MLGGFSFLVGKESEMKFKSNRKESPVERRTEGMEEGDLG